MSTPSKPTKAAKAPASKAKSKKPSNQPRPLWKPTGHNIYTQRNAPPNESIENRPLHRTDLHQSTPDFLGEDHDYTRSTTQKEDYPAWPLDSTSRSKSASLPSHIDQIDQERPADRGETTSSGLVFKSRTPYAADDQSFADKRADYGSHESGLDSLADTPKRSVSQPYDVGETTPYQRSTGPIGFEQGMEMTHSTRPTESQQSLEKRPYALDQPDMEVYHRQAHVAFHPGMEIRHCVSPHSELPYATQDPYATHDPYATQDPYGYNFSDPYNRNVDMPDTISSRFENDQQMEESHVSARVSSPRYSAQPSNVHFKEDPVSSLREDDFKSAQAAPTQTGPHESTAPLGSQVMAGQQLSPKLENDESHLSGVNPFMDRPIADVCGVDNVPATPGAGASDGYMSDDSIDNSPRRRRRQIDSSKDTASKANNDGYHSDASDMSVDSIDNDKRTEDKLEPGRSQEDRGESPDRKQVSFQIDWEPPKAAQPPRRKATSPGTGDTKPKPKVAKRDPIPAPETSIVYDSRMAASVDAPRYGRKKINPLKPRMTLLDQNPSDSLVFGHPLHDDQRDAYVKKPTTTARRAQSMDNLSHRKKMEAEKRASSHENLSRRPLDSKRTASPAPEKPAASKSPRARSVTPEQKRQTRPRLTLMIPEKENRPVRSPVEKKIATAPARKPNLKVTSRIDSGLNDKNRLKSPEGRKVELVNKPFFAGNVTSRIDSGNKNRKPTQSRYVQQQQPGKRAPPNKKLSSSTGDLTVRVASGGLKPSASLTDISVQTSPSLRRSTSDVAIQTDEESLNSSSELLDRGVGTSDDWDMVTMRPVSTEPEATDQFSSSIIPTNNSKPSSTEDSKKAKSTDHKAFWSEPKDVVIIEKQSEKKPSKSVEIGLQWEPVKSDPRQLEDKPHQIEPVRVKRTERSPQHDVLAEFDVFGATGPEPVRYEQARSEPMILDDGPQYQIEPVRVKKSERSPQKDLWAEFDDLGKSEPKPVQYELTKSEPMVIEEPQDKISAVRVKKNERSPQQDLLAEFDAFGESEPKQAHREQTSHQQSKQHSEIKHSNLVEFDLKPHRSEDNVDFELKHNNDPWTVQFETTTHAANLDNEFGSQMSPKNDKQSSPDSTRQDTNYRPSQDPRYIDEVKRFKADESSVFIVEKPKYDAREEFKKFKPDESSVVIVESRSAKQDNRSPVVNNKPSEIRFDDDFEPYSKPREPTSGFSQKTDSPKVKRPEKIDFVVSVRGEPGHERRGSDSSSSSSKSSKGPDHMRRKVVKHRQPEPKVLSGPKVFDLPDDFYRKQQGQLSSNSSGSSSPINERMDRSSAQRLSPNLEEQLRKLDSDSRISKSRRSSTSSSDSENEKVVSRGRSLPKNRDSHAHRDGRSSPLVARVLPSYSKPGTTGGLADIEISIDFEEERKEDANEKQMREIVTVGPDCKTVTTENVPHIDVSLAHLGDTPRPSDHDSDDGRPEITQTYGFQVESSVESDLEEIPRPISSSTPLPNRDFSTAREPTSRRSSTSSSSTVGENETERAPIQRPEFVGRTQAPLVESTPRSTDNYEAQKPIEYMTHEQKSYDPDVIIIDKEPVMQRQPDVVSYPEPPKEQGRPLTKVKDRISSLQKKPESHDRDRYVPLKSNVRNMTSLFEQKPQPSPEPSRRQRAPPSPAPEPFVVTKRQPTPDSSDSENERRNGRKPTETMKNLSSDPQKKKKKERRKKGKEDYRLEKVEPPHNYSSTMQMDVNDKQKDKKFVFVPLEFQFDVKPMVIIDKDNQNAAKREVEIAPQNIMRTEHHPEPVLDADKYKYKLHFSPMNQNLVVSDTEDISDVASSLDERDVDFNDVVSLHSDSSPNAYYTSLQKPTMYYVEQNGDPTAFPRIYRHPMNEMDSSIVSSDSSTSPASSLRGARLWTGVGKYSPHGARTERRIQQQSESQRMTQNVEVKTQKVTHSMDRNQPDGYNELKGPQVFVAGSAGENACSTCGQRVYEMEKLVADKQLFHKTCFKCSKCKRTLGVGNYATNEGKLLCKPHFMEIFRLRGHYEDRWSKENTPENHSDGVRPEDGEDGDGKIVRSEDKQEDDRDALPSLKNIKSRFENTDDNKPQVERPAPGKLKYKWSAEAARNKEVSPSPPRDPDIVREERSKEEVPMASGGIGNIKKQYMESIQKPVGSDGPPKPIQIPRQEFNRNEPSPSPQRDPTVVRAEDVQDEGQFMPAPQTTRGLVARFKQMEVDNAGQASPAKRVPLPNNVHAQKKGGSGPPPDPRVDLLEQERQIPDSGEFTNNPVTRDDVVTEWDEFPEQELPEVGAAKSRINLFRQKERETVQKSAPAFGDLYAPGGQMVNGDPNQKRVISSERLVNNQPDVIRHEEKSPEELPPQDLTKSMLSKFRQLEEEAKTKKQQEFVSPRRNPGDKQVIASRQNGTDVVDRPLFNPAKPEGGEFENNPQDLPDVVRESDPFDENELPEVGVTRNLLAKFQSMQT